MANDQKGTVKWFNDEKGFGFITPEQGRDDVFVHYTGIDGEGRRSLTQGDRVTYTIGQGRRGPEAQRVRVLG